MEACVSLLEIDPLLQQECIFRKKKKCPVQFSSLQSANLLAYSRAQSKFSEFLEWKGGGWQVDAGTDWALDLGSTLCLSGFEELKTGQITERFGPSCQNLSYGS